MKLLLNINSELIYEGSSLPVKNALAVLQRDIGKTCLPSDEKGCKIRLEKREMKEECFCIEADSFQNELIIRAGDEMGFIYGIYEVSREILGISNFWFWNDQIIVPKKGYSISETFREQSDPFSVRLRGWFVNDEVLIHKWSVNNRKSEPWEMVFEALLRCGGNMVIPGTDKNAVRYRETAAAMGLYITHHHAEPLGAEMFGRVYPELIASYDRYPEKFQALWKEAINRQKKYKVIWNLGFRGQGDRPFWEEDDRYRTPQERGKLMSSLIRLQYEMVRKEIPDAVCCTNLYGEAMELYKEGCLDLPRNVIRIWGDNGYGKMVSRRQMNHNPRVPALPEKNDEGKHGIYYHVSFYDLQAANHVTMLPNSPEFVKDELEKVLQCNMRNYWIINCSNVKPHIYFLDFIANLWKWGTIDVSRHRKKYISMYYSAENTVPVEKCLIDYHHFSVSYGEKEDEHAGEQFPNHMTRVLVSQYLADKSSPAGEMKWACSAPTLEEQIKWFLNLCKKGMSGYRLYMEECCEAGVSLTEIAGKETFFEPGECAGARRLFRDTMLLQSQILYFSYTGAFLAGSSMLTANRGNYREAYYLAGYARENFLKADKAMRLREHGKWRGFYANECLTDVKQSGWVMEGLMSYIRNLGDGPHFYEWQSEFMDSEEDQRIKLILNMDNHLKDLELYELMKADEAFCTVAVKNLEKL